MKKNQHQKIQKQKTGKASAVQGAVSGGSRRRKPLHPQRAYAPTVDARTKLVHLRSSSRRVSGVELAMRSALDGGSSGGAGTGGAAVGSISGGHGTTVPRSRGTEMSKSAGAGHAYVSATVGTTATASVCVN